MKITTGVRSFRNRPSRVYAQVAASVTRAARQFGGEGQVFDIAKQPGLAIARRLDDLGPMARRLAVSLLHADETVVESMMRKCSFTDVSKHASDHPDAAAWQPTPVLLVASGGGDRHALVVERFATHAQALRTRPAGVLSRA